MVSQTVYGDEVKFGGGESEACKSALSTEYVSREEHPGGHGLVDRPLIEEHAGPAHHQLCDRRLVRHLQGGFHSDYATQVLY